MKENDVSYLYISLGFFKVLRDMLLQKFFIGTAHLGTNTCHYIRTLVLIELPSTLLLTAHVLRVRLSHDNLIAFENLKEEFTSMAQN